MSEKYKPFPSIARFPGEACDDLPTESTSVLASSPESMQISDLLTRSMFGNSAEKSDAILELNSLTKSSQMTGEVYSQLYDRASSTQSPIRSEIYKNIFHKFRPFTHLPNYEDKIDPEALIAQDSGSSPSPSREIVEDFSIPENMHGLRILDLGAGASDFTSYALSRGADAFAIDPRYINRHHLISFVKKAYASKPEIGKRYSEAISNFEKSILDNPLRYLPAMATDLPFEDKSFDLVISQFFMLSYLNLDLNVLKSGINESLRILRDDGRLSLFPYMTQDFSCQKGETEKPDDIQKMKNNSLLLQFLKEQGKRYTITPISEVSGKMWKRLDIFNE